MSDSGHRIRTRAGFPEVRISGNRSADFFRCRRLGVGLAAVPLPLPLELVVEDLGAASSGQPGLGQRQLAHLHVVLPRVEQDGRLVGLHLHLPRDPAAVEVRVPPENSVTLIIDGFINEKAHPRAKYMKYLY